MKDRVLVRGRRGWRFILLSTCLLALTAARAQAPQGTPPALTGLKGGLVVQLGAADTQAPAALSRTGRYLVHVLATDPAAVAAARAQLRAKGYYGLASAEHLADPRHLPYADNLVNLIVVDDIRVPAAELFRVTAPMGAVAVRRPGVVSKADLKAAGFTTPAAGGYPLVARKPWPAGMDVWPHPRHGADGNAVSNDTLVGPPERIRWVAGAVSEVEGIVSAGGRNFYGGVLALDAFNGLRLWHRDLRKGTLNAALFRLPRLSRNRARPVASDAFVLAVEQGRLVALDAADGRLVRTFPGATRPTEAVYCRETVVACDSAGVHAYRAGTGEPLWSRDASGARNLAADGRLVSFIHGRPARGEAVTATAVSLESGAVRWQRSDYPWLGQAKRTVLHGDYLAYEVSSFNDHDVGNALHVVSADTGEPLWEKAYPPGMNHNRQARAMFVGDRLWILHGGATNMADRKHIKRLPIQTSALDPRTGETLATYPAGLTHCFPPVATRRFLLSGVMDLVDFATGKIFVNPITKANCSKENGWVPANGLIYTSPKHCTCWPILRGFVALAPRGSGRDTGTDTAPVPVVLQRGPAQAAPNAPGPSATDWPLYRHDRWRSASTKAPGPRKLNTLWSMSLAGRVARPDGPILHDWSEDTFVKGPVSAPTIANGRVYVSRPDAHEVLALDADTGAVCWRFTANGRVDTPPALYRGLCLFGSRSGSVYALRADTGQVVWRLRAGPTGERIVAYGQLESPWPVPGAVLVMHDVAYFAAGWQPLADGGIRVFAVDPLSGRRLWSRRINSIPQKGYYENSGLEFDPFDILHQEGDGIALSRWIISKDGKQVKVDKRNAFARLNTGGGAVWVPRGCWTYGPRHQHRFGGEAPRRPLCAFRDHSVFSSLNGTTVIFRRDFDLEHGEKFKNHWITGWEAAQKGRKGGNPFRTYRLAEKALWKADPFAAQPAPAKPRPRRPGTQLYNNLYAMALAGDGRLFVIHKDGRLKVVATADGAVLETAQVPPPAWDGLAIANRRLYLTTQAGDVLCVGE